MNIEVEVDIVRLDTEFIDEHLRFSAGVLKDILNSGDQCNTEENGSMGRNEEGHLCINCGKSYKSTHTLNIHYQLKHPQGSQEAHCSVCDKDYPSLLSLQKHVRYMHQYELRCSVCYRTFTSVQKLQHHGETCFKSEAPCKFCSKIFNSPLALRNHINYMHPQEKSHVCDVCQRTFRTSRWLSNHVSSAHATGLNCIQCDKKFKCKASLNCHLLTKHSERSAKCTLCRKVLASRGNLSRHLNKVHDIASAYNAGEQKFFCGVCKLDFQSASDLIQHVCREQDKCCS